MDLQQKSGHLKKAKNCIHTGHPQVPANPATAVFYQSHTSYRPYIQLTYELTVGNVPSFEATYIQAGRSHPLFHPIGCSPISMSETFFSIPDLRICSYGTTIAAGVMLWILEGLHPWLSGQKHRTLHATLNLSIAGLNLLILLPSGILMAFMLDWSRNVWPGIGILALPPVAKAIVIILLIDLWMYVWHRLNHESRFLWRFHSIHHSDATLDVTTSWRFHYMEILLSELLRLPLFMLMGAGIEHLLLYSLLMTPVIAFHHSNVSIPPALDRLARLIIPSPMMHRLHHSTIRSEHDSNYGSMLSVWDRLFGSFLMRDNLEGLRLGLDLESDSDKQHLFALLTRPFRP